MKFKRGKKLLIGYMYLSCRAGKFKRKANVVYCFFQYVREVKMRGKKLLFFVYQAGLGSLRQAKSFLLFV